MYGDMLVALVLPLIALLKPLSVEIPESRPRAILSVARSSGNPSKLFRSAPVTNSSISFPV